MNGFYIGKEEAFEMAVSILAIALALSFVSAGLSIEPSRFIFLMAAFTITIGSGFVLHEMAHKYVAIRYGARARFSAWPLGLAGGLGLAIIPQIFGWRAPLFIAPGAVYIYAARHISQKENGIISLAGPAANWAIAIAFLAFAIIFMDNPIVSGVADLGIRANFGLAMFNLLPIFPLDGSKVISWNWRVWLAAFAFSFLGFGMFGF
ncbi:MAG: site-2 protease family protein [Candidatus Micrarchaeia archaeon]